MLECGVLDVRLHLASSLSSAHEFRRGGGGATGGVGACLTYLLFLLCSFAYRFLYLVTV